MKTIYEYHNQVFNDSHRLVEFLATQSKPSAALFDVIVHEERMCNSLEMRDILTRAALKKVNNHVAIETGKGRRTVFLWVYNVLRSRLSDGIYMQDGMTEFTITREMQRQGWKTNSKKPVAAVQNELNRNSGAFNKNKLGIWELTPELRYRSEE